MNYKEKQIFIFFEENVAMALDKYLNLLTLDSTVYTSLLVTVFVLLLVTLWVSALLLIFLFTTGFVSSLFW